MNIVLKGIKYTGKPEDVVLFRKGVNIKNKFGTVGKITMKSSPINGDFMMFRDCDQIVCSNYKKQIFWN